MSTRREFLTGGLCLGLSTGVWRAAAPTLLTPDLTGLFPGSEPLPPWVVALVEGQLRTWEQRDEAAISRMRSTNPEWDFMGRTFLVLALANLVLRQPEHAPRYLEVIDTIIRGTQKAEAERSMYHFLLPYARAKDWAQKPARSLFVDGELLAMLAAQELVAPGSVGHSALEQRARLVIDQMRAGPTSSAESYPDECWTFCNTTAIAALRMSEAAGVSLDPSLPGDWLTEAKAQLVHPETGILVSSYRHGGDWLDGPEGSSIWMSAHNLSLIDPSFARQQYTLARDQLGRSFMGFGYAKEWPSQARGPSDVDSGPVIPLLDASPGSSGLALLGARAFDDRPYLEQLLAALELAAFPHQRDGERHYRASNLLGDAVLTYALCFGPLWELVQERNP